MPVSCHPVLVRYGIRMHLCWICQCCIGAALSVLPYFRKARTQVVYLSRTSDKYTTQCMLEHISQIWLSTRCVCHEQKRTHYKGNIPPVHRILWSYCRKRRKLSQARSKIKLMKLDSLFHAVWSQVTLVPDQLIAQISLERFVLTGTTYDKSSCTR